MTLIAVDVVAVEGTVQEDILPELRRVLEGCINPDQDVLLALDERRRVGRDLFHCRVHRLQRI